MKASASIPACTAGFGWFPNDLAHAAHLSARFTRFAILGNDAAHCEDYGGYLKVRATDSELLTRGVFSGWAWKVNEPEVGAGRGSSWGD